MQYEGIKPQNTFDVRELFSVHYFKYNKLFSVPGEKHNFWEIVYADAGKVGVIADKLAYELEGGEMIFHKPNEFHKVFTGDNVGFTAIVSFSCSSPAMKQFEGKIMRPDESEKSLLKGIVREASLAFSDRLDEIYLPKMTLRENIPTGALQKIKCMLELLLISLARDGEKIKNPGRQNPELKAVHTNELTKLIIDILIEKRFSSVSLDDLSHRLFFSKTYLKTLFKNQMNESIMSYFSRLKLEQAKLLLADGLSVTETGDKLGFCGIHYFSRFFKKHTGITPSEYILSIKVDDLII